MPAVLWLLAFFAVPFYVVLSVAFGTVDPLFRTPLPTYEPWYWDLSTFTGSIEKFYAGSAIYQPALLRTLAYIIAASAICLMLGYAVAYYTARYAGRYAGPILVGLVAPFWISYLMRIYAWQSLLQPDGYINDALGAVGFGAVDWLSGQPVTVVLGLVYGYIPYMILPLYASLDRIDRAMLEAGRDLGAGPFHTFVRVTLPLSKQAILAGVIIVSLPMFGDYYTNDLLGSTNTAMYGNLINESVIQAGQSAQAASLVLVLTVLLVAPMLYYLRETRRAAEGR